MKKLIFLVALLLIASCRLAHATTYYVDTTGSDSNDGSSVHPFLTIQKGSDTAITPGDTVCVNNGTYTTTFTKYGNPGTVDNPITFRNCQGGSVIIDPSDKVTTWTSLGGNLWEADTGSASSIGTLIWKNTTFLGIGQSSCATVDTQDEWCVSTHSRLETYSTTNPSSSIYSFLGIGPKVSNTSYIVFDGISVYFGGHGWQIGYPSSNPTGATSNITLKNAEVYHSGTRGVRVIGSVLYPTDHIYIDHMTIHDVRDRTASNGHCIKFDANEDGYENSYAYVTDSSLYDCDYHGVQFSDGWQQGFFHGNTIHDISQKGEGTGAGIRCGDVLNCNIYDNVLYGGTNPLGTGIYLQDLADPTNVYRNRIYGFNFNAISIFRVSKTPGNLYIYNNLIYNNLVSGISLYSTSSTYIYNNTFYNNAGYQINATSANATGVDIRNNIIYSSSADFALGLGVDGSFTENHNLLLNSASNIISYNGVAYGVADYQTASGQGSGDLQLDPLFVNGLSDLSLQSTSPGIDSGTNVASVLTTDFNGDFRPQGSGTDIGAYEFANNGYGVKEGAKLLNGVKKQ